VPALVMVLVLVLVAMLVPVPVPRRFLHRPARRSLSRHRR
jgi:hypothetical protein